LVYVVESLMFSENVYVPASGLKGVDIISPFYVDGFMYVLS
jgi:hypothetical protein